MNQTTQMQSLPSALLIADYLLFKGQKEGTAISNKKLQKLLYYTQAWSVAIKGQPVFGDKIEAWIHGPAIKSVYVEYQKYGAQPIIKVVTSASLDAITEETKKFIDEVWAVYAKYDANYLEYLTHSESPWREARGNLESHTSSENEITLQSMKSFYSTLKKKNQTTT